MIWAIVALGCAGPRPLDRAIRPADQVAYDAAVPAGDDAPREAYLRWRAAQRGLSFQETARADAKLTRNPYSPRDAQAISFGAIVYTNRCMECHGVDADGQGWTAVAEHPAKNFRSGSSRLAVALFGGPPPGWFPSVRGGYGPIVAYSTGESRAMPAYGEQLSNEQIWMVLTYLASNE